SPEQVRGETVDHRSDIFSLGCVIYQMASGNPPFTRTSASETVAAILRDEPPPLSPPMPPSLQSTIRTCLAKNPADRFQSAQEGAAGLEGLAARPAERPSQRRLTRRWLLASALGAAVIAAGTGLWWRVARAPQFDSLAVLPLANATGDA